MIIEQFVRQGRNIVGFVYRTESGKLFYVFGTPDQANFRTCECLNVESGVKRIRELQIGGFSAFKNEQNGKNKRNLGNCKRSS